MADFWLNQRNGLGNTVTYDTPGEYTIFGGAVVSEIQTEMSPTPNSDVQGVLHLFRRLSRLQSADLGQRTQGREVLPPIAGLSTGAPQNNIYKLSVDDFRAIVEAAGVDHSLLSC